MGSALSPQGINFQPPLAYKILVPLLRKHCNVHSHEHISIPSATELLKQLAATVGVVTNPELESQVHTLLVNTTDQKHATALFTSRSKFLRVIYTDGIVPPLITDDLKMRFPLCRHLFSMKHWQKQKKVTQMPFLKLENVTKKVGGIRF